MLSSGPVVLWFMWFCGPRASVIKLDALATEDSMSETTAAFLPVSSETISYDEWTLDLPLGWRPSCSSVLLLQGAAFVGMSLKCPGVVCMNGGNALEASVCFKFFPSLWGITSQSQQAPNSDFACSHTERFSILTCPWLKVDDEAAWRLLWV